MAHLSIEKTVHDSNNEPLLQHHKTGPVLYSTLMALNG